MEVKDLINDLNAETENANIGNTAPVVDVPPADQHTDRQPGPDEHFEPLTEEQKQNTTQQPDADFSPVKAKSMAERYTKMFSSLLKILLTPLYRWSILEKEDPKKMAEFRQKHAGQSEKAMDEALHSDHTMWPVVNRFDKYMKAVEEIPLDKDEIEMISQPLSDLIYQYRSYRLSPGWMLVVALCIVMVPRLVHAIPDLKKAAQPK